MIALIDGDCLVYSCGFASDAAAKKEGLEHEDLSYCLNGVKKTINSIVDIVGANDYVVFVSGSLSYRKDTYADYKANRDPSHKPYWYEEIRNYLFEKHDAQWSAPGDEADDALGITQCASKNTIICSLDKDLDCIPGWHYNFSKTRKENGVYFIEEEEANRFFYKQILTGDSTDNIPGMYKKLGKKATSKYTGPLDRMETPAEMFEHVVRCYDGDVEWVKWVGNLVWIKRSSDGVWLPA